MFTVKNSGYVAKKSIEATGSGVMKVVGDGANSSLYVIDLDNLYSGFVIVKNTNLELENFTIKNAFSKDVGSALKVNNVASNILINNLIFKTNCSKVAGGAIYLEGDITELKNVQFYGNYVLSDTPSESLHGGAIFSLKSLTIKADNGPYIIDAIAIGRSAKLIDIVPIVM